MAEEKETSVNEDQSAVEKSVKTPQQKKKQLLRFRIKLI